MTMHDRITQTAFRSGRLSRRAALGALSGAAVASVAACGKSTDGSAGGSPGSDQDQVTISYGLWAEAQLPGMKAIVAAFEKANPSIKVDIQVTPNDTYWTKLQTAATAGSAPDVFWMTYPEFYLYALNKILMPLKDRIAKANIDLSQYRESAIKGYSLGGELYALPKDIDSMGLWYNKKLFAAANLKAPDASWKWNDLVAAARILTKGDVFGVAAELNDHDTYYNTIPQGGGFVISDDKKKSGWDDPGSIAGVQFLVDMILKEKVSPTLQQMTDTKANQMFSSGKVAMYYGGSWQAAAFKTIPYALENADAAPMPMGKAYGNVSNSIGNVIYAKTKHPEESWKFLQFLGSQEAANIQADTGVVIPATKGTEAAWVKSVPQFNLQVFVDALDRSYAFPASANTNVWRKYAAQQFASAWTGDKSVADVASDCARQMNEALAKEPTLPT